MTPSLGRYGRLWARFWTDERVTTLDEGSTLAAAYVLAGRQQNLIGCASFSIGMAAEDCKTSPQTFAERFANLRGVFGWNYDAARVLFIPGWWPWHLPDNPNILKGWLRDVESVPKGESLSLFFQSGLDLPENLRETFRQTLTERFGEGFSSEQETFSLRRRLRRRDTGSEKLGDSLREDRPVKAKEVANPGANLVEFLVRPSGSWWLTESAADEIASRWQVDRAFVVEAAENANRWIRRPGQDNRKTARGMLRFLSDQVGRRIDFKGAPGGGAKGRGTDFATAGGTADSLAGLFDEPVGRGES